MYIRCRSIVITSALTIVLLLASCSYNRSLRKANEGAWALADSLPVLDELEVITSVSENWAHTVYGETCYYGRVYRVYGTSLPQAEALRRYSLALEDAGWALEDKPGAPVYLRGAHETVSVSSGVGPIIASDETFAQKENLYPTILVLDATYALPNTETCY